MGRYQDALDFIFGYVNYERPVRFDYNAVTLNLGRVHDLLDRLGRPQDRFRCVHIAGTKGKGSTSAMIESVLRAAGYRTGLYTSPHLHTFRERIRCGGALIPKAHVAAVLAEARPAIEATPGITTFEIMTALAFSFFAQQGVEWAVVETGLGGRLDATNVVQPAVCAITSLSYDHVELLGHTLALIAQEKAGIIKAGTPVVSAPQAPEAAAVIEQVSAAQGARLVTAGVDWTAEPRSADLSGQTLTLRRTADGWTLPDLRIALLGDHQLVNTTVAVAVLDELRGQGVRITEQTLRVGLAEARWPGRFELLNQQPALILDCAHNEDSMHWLRKTLADFLPSAASHRLALVFGASADKDISGMLKMLLLADPGPTLSAEPMGSYTPPVRVIATRSGHPRQAAPNQLAATVKEVAPTCAIAVTDSLDAALADALIWATPNDTICVTGSIFVVAQARRAWAALHPEAFPADDWVFHDETPGHPVPDDAAEAL
jgi:dihydrofolate synthase/folylpolyglutamate synthase